MKIHYVVEDRPLGTAGAIKNVEDYLEDETFLVFNGDILSNMDLTDIINFHRDKKSDCTIVLTPVDNPMIYGVVELDHNKKIMKFTEKPKAEDVRSNLINAGLYVLEPEVLERMEKGKKYSIERQIFPVMLEDDKHLYGYNYGEYWMDIGTPFKYLSANQDLILKKMDVNIGLVDGIYKGANVEIDKRASLEPPLWIGEDVAIAEGAMIKGPAVIHRGCEIGVGSTVEGALMWENTRLGDGARLESCLVGRNSRIGDGAKIGKLAVVGSNEVVDDGFVMEPESRMYKGSLM